MSNSLKRLSIIGIGPSDKAYIYPLAEREIKSADILAGSSSVLDRFKHLSKDLIKYESEFNSWIKEVEKAVVNKRVAILVSGDPGFYSLSRLVIDYFKPEIPRILPGISSLQIACARIGKPWNNVKVISLHGRNVDTGNKLSEDGEVAVLMDNRPALKNLGRILSNLGYGNRGIYIFSNLGWPDEVISHIKVSELEGKTIPSNSILILEAYKRKDIKFYGMGVGIGGPDMITVKGLSVIKDADIICIPRAEKSPSSLAMDSIKKFIPYKTEIIEFKYPMLRNREGLMKYWEKAADIIIDNVNKNRIVAMVTIGDPLLYSTYNYILSILKKHLPSNSIETVPGINSFSYAASRFQESLLEKDEKMAVLPCSRNLDGYIEILKQFDTVVLMKIGKNLREVIKLIQSSGREDEAYYFKDMGFAGEISGLAVKNIKSTEKGYLSTIIIKRKKF